MLIHFLYDSITIMSVLFSQSIQYFFYRNYELFIKNLVFNISKINIFYTKLLQASASNDYFDEITNQYLIQITDNVPYKKEEIDKELLWKIQRQFGIHIFNSVEEDIIPINAGSISLVFVDKDYKYAIKIKRKNIEKQIEHTVRYLTILSNIISHIPYLRKLRVHNFLQENLLKLYEQLDFQKEVDNMTYFLSVYQNIDYVYIPKVLPHITEQYPNIIVSEYIDNAYRIENIHEDKKEIFAKILLKVVFFGALKTCIHGDLHSGNILFTEKNGHPQVVLLDFGIIFKLDKKFSRELFKIMFHHEDYTVDQLSLIFLKSLLTISPTITENNNQYIKEMRQYTDKVVSTLKNKSKFDLFSLLDCMSKLMIYIDENNLKKHGIDVNQDYVYLNICIMMSTTIASKLCKNDIIIFMNCIFKEMFEFQLYNS